MNGFSWCFAPANDSTFGVELSRTNIAVLGMIRISPSSLEVPLEGVRAVPSQSQGLEINDSCQTHLYLIIYCRCKRMRIRSVERLWRCLHQHRRGVPVQLFGGQGAEQWRAGMHRATKATARGRWVVVVLAWFSGVKKALHWPRSPPAQVVKDATNARPIPSSRKTQHPAIIVSAFAEPVTMATRS